jgi:hypothetical protein
VEKGLRVQRILNKKIGNSPCACWGEVEQDGDMGSVSQLASEPVFQAGNGALTHRSAERRQDFTRQCHHGLPFCHLPLSICMSVCMDVSQSVSLAIFLIL